MYKVILVTDFIEARKVALEEGGYCSYYAMDDGRGGSVIPVFVPIVPGAPQPVNAFKPLL